jgi:hypothetical protein
LVSEFGEKSRGSVGRIEGRAEACVPHPFTGSEVQAERRALRVRFSGIGKLGTSVWYFRFKKVN